VCKNGQEQKEQKEQKEQEERMQKNVGAVFGKAHNKWSRKKGEALPAHNVQGRKEQ